MRTPIAALAIGTVLLLSGCASAEHVAGATLGEWTANIGERWDVFVAEVLAPVANALLAILISWLSIAVVARLVTLIPGVRNIKATQRTGRTLRVVGWTLVAVTPIVTVLATAFAVDSFVMWLAVSTPLAYAAVGTLGPGLATRPSVDAKVITADGAASEAWSIDALWQLRKVSMDDPRMRPQEANLTDLGEFITIADRTGSGLASAIAWVLQLLFNSAPWRLQVTVVDTRSAIAIMRRNGRVIDEVEIGVDQIGTESDGDRKLLALAAAFAAVTMAGRYPDLAGGPGETDWHSMGFLRIARMTTGAERRHYLARAIESDLTNELAEFEAVADELEHAGDLASLERIMSTLDPIVKKEVSRAGARNHSARRERARQRGGPHSMEIRSLALYLSAARRWVAVRALTGSEENDAAASARSERTLSTVVSAVVTLLKELHDTEVRGVSSNSTSLTRLRGHAAESYRIFRGDADIPWASDEVEDWICNAESSKDAETAYSYACYLAWQSVDEATPRADVDLLAEDVIRRLGALRVRSGLLRRAATQPEFRLLADRPGMREAVLAPIASAWEITTFTWVQDRLSVHGIHDPVEVLADDGATDRLDAFGVGPEELRRFIDGARLLRAVQEASHGDLARIDELRAARHLIDEQAYTPQSFRSTLDSQPDELTGALAEAVYWVPSPSEVHLVSSFVQRLGARLEGGADARAAELA